MTDTKRTITSDQHAKMCEMLARWEEKDSPNRSNDPFERIAHPAHGEFIDELLEAMNIEVEKESAGQNAGISTPANNEQPNILQVVDNRSKVRKFFNHYLFNTSDELGIVALASPRPFTVYQKMRFTQFFGGKGWNVSLCQFDPEGPKRV